MMLIEETAPAAEALPVAALREHLRLGSGFQIAEDSAETAALTGYLRAAIATIEARTGKVLLTRRFRMQLDDWRDRLGQPLPLAPVISVQGISIEDGAGTVTEMAAESWRLLPDGQRPMILPTGVILPHVPRRGSVTVMFTAGFGADWAAVPADLAQAVLMLAARYYEDRSFEGSKGAMPFGVSALIERWRQVRTLAGRGSREMR
ncbi:phage head-tail connector protein [Paracoccus sp. R12_1]|uniref:head-tail connector protein n=1 Tax=unclassified Paracoccus (in: a-proteobacteria) TaxID=2688777 RepID=UPI001ADAA908|nr:MULTISPECIES: phage head-tail connector protein [unclassified Paracoccus (in: a-proteobacteria)]MBO9455911.1 phage head-tail connector protein [Paracoccus sp. R12_2]MBO9486673.1 phage head-tail connector protein [Paracoccus sp. R12_1]